MKKFLKGSSCSVLQSLIGGLVAGLSFGWGMMTIVIVLDMIIGDFDTALMSAVFTKSCLYSSFFFFCALMTISVIEGNFSGKKATLLEDILCNS